MERQINVIIGMTTFDGEDRDLNLLQFIGRALHAVSDDFTLQIEGADTVYKYDNLGADGHHKGITNP